MKLKVLSALLFLMMVFTATAANARPYYGYNQGYGFGNGGGYGGPCYHRHHHRRWHRW